MVLSGLMDFEVRNLLKLPSVTVCVFGTVLFFLWPFVLLVPPLPWSETYKILEKYDKPIHAHLQNTTYVQTSPSNKKTCRRQVFSEYLYLCVKCSGESKIKFLLERCRNNGESAEVFFLPKLQIENRIDIIAKNILRKSS